MSDHPHFLPSLGRRLELPDMILGTEDGCGLTSLVLGVLLLGAQAMLPPAPGLRDSHLSVADLAPAPLRDEAEPFR